MERRRRPSFSQRRKVAEHEAGHIFVLVANGHASAIKKATIVPSISEGYEGLTETDGSVNQDVMSDALAGGMVAAGPEGSGSDIYKIQLLGVKSESSASHGAERAIRSFSEGTRSNWVDIFVDRETLSGFEIPHVLAIARKEEEAENQAEELEVVFNGELRNMTDVERATSDHEVIIFSRIKHRFSLN